MIKKRLSAFVIVKDNLVVQSFGYRKYLPIGSIECVIENLDRWNVDEIVVINIDRNERNKGPNMTLLEKILNLNVSTPLVFGGGIRNSDEAIRIVKEGAERVLIEKLLHENPIEVEKASKTLGKQAIIATLPVVLKDNKILYYNYSNSKEVKIDVKDFNQKIKFISELVIIDKINEGYNNSFNMDIIEKFRELNISIIPFGGLNNLTSIDKALSISNVSAIGLGNFLNYKENQMQNFKKLLNNNNLRNAEYRRENWSF